LVNGPFEIARMGRSRRKALPAEPLECRIEGLAPDGRGVCRLEGKTVFVDEALPGERVLVHLTRRRRRFDEARAVEVLEASTDRVAPRCPHYGLCGGCSLQHMNPRAQRRAKEQGMLDQLRHLGGVEPARVYAPVSGPDWAYRHKARLGVKYVGKKGRVLVGFRERRSPYVADLRRCEVLVPEVGERLAALAELIMGLEARSNIPQIEVAAGDGGACTLVFRHLEPLSAADRRALEEFGRATGLQIQLQPGGPDTVTDLWPPDQTLSYRLPNHDVKIDFRATDFTQVNRLINQAMVDRALELLDPQRDDDVLDLYCGLGNFALPLARRAAFVAGVEAAPDMVERAAENARRNGIGNVSFWSADLELDPADRSWVRPYDRVLMDPPRTGARAVVEHMERFAPRRIVYVSCHPATLARDAGILVRDRGYRLVGAGIIDMFPHTAHVESIAVFDKHD
jgi:23S rRNA (uracil1939-C5)-methyltransferase